MAVTTARIAARRTSASSQVRGEFGDRLRYVFRHRPISGSDIARRAAELVESIEDADKFWDAHVALMTRSKTLTEEDLGAVADKLGLARQDAPDTRAAQAAAERAKARVDRDVESARASGVQFTPTFFINGRRYDGPWDESSFSDAMLAPLGYRVRTAALSFASWAPSTGVLLLLASVAGGCAHQLGAWRRALMHFGTLISALRLASSIFGCRCWTGSTTVC